METNERHVISNANTLFNHGNNSGQGFDPGADEVNNCASALDSVLVHKANTMDDIAVYRRNDGSGWVLVGDANGAWAVEVTA